MNGVYCIGCGEDMQCRKAYDRRVLYTIQGEEVRVMWKEILSSKGCLDIDIDKMVGTKENPRYMCRSCFDKYKTSVKVRTELLGKAENALAKMTTAPRNISTRKRRDTALEQPPSKRLFLEDEQMSPAVVVSD